MPVLRRVERSTEVLILTLCEQLDADTFLLFMMPLYMYKLFIFVNNVVRCVVFACCASAVTL